MAGYSDVINPIDSNEGSTPKLTREEGWALIKSAFGSAKEMYSEAGGAEAFLRSERASWGEGTLR